MSVWVTGYLIVAAFFFVFNMNWLIKNETNITRSRVGKYTLLALAWPYQFFLQFTNRGI